VVELQGHLGRLLRKQRVENLLLKINQEQILRWLEQRVILMNGAILLLLNDACPSGI
jgi:hypothetical protein